MPVAASLSQIKYPEVWEILRPYQKEVVEKAIQDKRHLMYLDMGMGKGLVTLLTVMETEAFPCMIVCSKSAMYVLEEELRKWFDEPATMYVGKPKQRDKAFSDFARLGHKFIITNYSLSEELGQKFGIVDGQPKRGSSNRGTTSTPTPGTKHKWNIGALVADEIQRGGLFNHKTKTYKVFKQLAKAAEHVYFLTGTPYRRGVVDFYGPLSLIRPDKFDSYWKYVGKYCRTIDTGFGKSIERNPKDVVKFREMIRKYASILKKTDHLKDMPSKIRQAVPVEMDPEQARIYWELTDELFAETDDGELIITPGVLTLSIRQRQLLVCPQELGLKTRGAAINTMIEMAGDLVEDRKPFVVFTPFRKAVPWIKAAIREEFGSIKVHEITGGLNPKQFADEWQGFQNGRGPRVLICVIKSGASFHATSADTAFFLGYEFDFNENTQAEDRLYRIGQTKTVNCYYMLHRGTVEDDIMQILNDKTFSADLVLSNENMFKRMLAKRGVKS
jgi:SWI/SNF-related matrix-associated actin-dependent regulator of chromatin subfamily A-like protein 1